MAPRKGLSAKVKKAWADTKEMAGKLLVPKANPKDPKYKAWKAKKDAEMVPMKRKYDLKMTE